MSVGCFRQTVLAELVSDAADAGDLELRRTMS
jgi:hypothetical protein